MSSDNFFKIIIIDDNPEIHRDFIKILTKGNNSELNKISKELFDEENEESLLPAFSIDSASQGQEGVERIKKALESGEPYALAFVDIRMPPGWDGVETIKHIWKLDEDIQIVICTAYSDYSWEDTVANLGQTDNLLILKKPFDNIAVRQLACALTRKWQLNQDARKYTDNLKQQVEDRTVTLQKSLSLVKATLESSSDGILVINNDGNVMDCNKKLLEMLNFPTGKKSEDIEIFKCFRNQLDDPNSFFDKFKNYNDSFQETSIDIIHFKDGRIVECYTQPHVLNDKIIGRVMDFRDITNRARLEQELQHQATHDPLTDLPNRVLLLERINQAIRSSDQTHVNFALLFLDLDRFKLINDSLSHSAGDELLREVATRLNSSVRVEDTLARLGGDEFVIILPGVKNKSSIINKLHSILEIFKQTIKINNRDVTITGSIGVSIYPQDGATGELLLRNADAAMYRAKDFGGNNFQFYSSEMNLESLAKLDQEMQMRQAILKDEFFLVYQPQIDLSTGKLVAVEALIRWNHPEKGLLLPMDFIPLAEETGLILPIGEWVMRSACKQNKKWIDAGVTPIRVAVNVTAQQFKQQNLPSVVDKILQETGLPPEFLELELTENVIVSNLEVIKTVEELKKLGVMIALDDFGTGYSSLSYLHKIPIDRLKIDASFIQHIKSAKDDEVIIRAVIAMAKNLNLEVLAEGVETQNQLEFLKRYKCGDVQGFYFSKPLNVEEIEIILKDPTKLNDTKIFP